MCELGIAQLLSQAVLGCSQRGASQPETCHPVEYAMWPYQFQHRGTRKAPISGPDGPDPQDPRNSLNRTERDHVMIYYHVLASFPGQLTAAWTAAGPSAGGRSPKDVGSEYPRRDCSVLPRAEDRR